MTIVGLLLGSVLGIGFYAWWLHKKSSASLRVPHKWPLVSRVLLSIEELEVLRWVQSIFPEHLVMVKLPVLRFTAPLGGQKSTATPRWQPLLDGVYCTFTVCTIHGVVVGCVDVTGKRGLSKANRDLKESLLSDCHIAYRVVRSDKLPLGSAMRAAFLGELEAQDEIDYQQTRGGDSIFNAELLHFAQQRK